QKEEQVQKRLEALDKLTKTLAIVEQYYVDDQNISDLVDKSLSGLLSNLDAHSSFLNEKDFNDMKIQTNG
ncbi:peptidase S41, partial [Campylobacter sp. CH185]